jgi:asparagine synthase (glutamine-hydrolysing)
MCGIAGALALDGSAPVTGELVTRMRETLVHRGPDGAATWVSEDGRVGLGFRRLAIVDLTDGAMQPMPNEDGSVRVVYNGEIYNHAELRRELEGLGHRFRSDHSDTEVIVHGYEQWGKDCLARFRGMFAFALWDGRRRSLWLARDRLGIKPLYYTAAGGRVAFASEPKALLADPGLKRELDPEALFHYLSFLTVPAPLTLFRGIRKLAAATWIQFDVDGAVAERRYWEPWGEAEPLTGAAEAELAELVLAELRISVRLRKLADVPVGVFLSGGVDSSANAALFAEGEQRPVETFTIGYEGDNPGYRNEFDWARRMAAHIGAAHHERLLTQQETIDFLPQMVRLTDEPIADPVAVPLFHVCELARRSGVVVGQSGEGADELFLGYPSWRTLLRLQRLDDLPVPATAKRLALAAIRAGGGGRSRQYELLRRGAEGLPVFWGGAEAFTEAEKRRLLAPALSRELSGLSSWDVVEPIHRRFRAGSLEQSHLHWMTYLDLNLRLPELLLARIDRMSMGVSLEARVPFLDHRLVELALAIPQRAQANGGSLKPILRRSLRGVVPDELLDRPKQGFRVPVEDWLRGPLGDHARAEVRELARTAGLLDPAAVEHQLERPRRSTWYLLNLALWWKEQIAC